MCPHALGALTLPAVPCCASLGPWDMCTDASSSLSWAAMQVNKLVIVSRGRTSRAEMKKPVDYWSVCRADNTLCPHSWPQDELWIDLWYGDWDTNSVLTCRKILLQPVSYLCSTASHWFQYRRWWKSPSTLITDQFKEIETLPLLNMQQHLYSPPVLWMIWLWHISPRSEDLSYLFCVNSISV